MVFSEKMVFKANAFSEEKKYSLLIKIIVCQGAMTFMNLCVGTQLQYKKKNYENQGEINKSQYQMLCKLY